MDLLSGKLYWPTTVTNPASYPPLTEDVVCDVLVIGGGSSGAQSAYLLAKEGLKVVVVDQRRIGEGSSSTNTALIQYAGDKSFVSLANTFGEEIAARHLKLCEQAIHDIETTCSQLPVDADFVRRDSLYYASYEKDIPALEQELNLLTKYGFHVDRWDEEKISSHFPFRKQAALYYYDDAEMNPLKFIYGLLEAVEKMGGKVWAETQVTGHRFEEDSAVFYTKNRHQIKAKHVIIAAGYENQEFKVEKNAVINSSYAVITTPVPDLSSWYKRALIWETARPYIYLRTTPDDRVIIGGMDKDTAYASTRDSKILHTRDKLMKELFKLFPNLQAEPEFYLGAFYGGTHDGLPIIGQYEEYPHCYVIMGYGDNGTVYNAVLSRILRDVIVKGSNPDLGIYLQNRPQVNET
ncbi:FAD-dependent oxidoreductase [Paenibacillus polygoni]|uniref:FAD-dependent oxidoreductase n=1 Tax=Paenibacillus polygoni TaxID=3050112 RepID=A0ABY8X3J1_9BACL|nr:FAD-dependent oxidoreductase [Paenibacillus polygoni]WIV19017.1 FAD-dependent oxidoreductase [Paenibacillus polygoni]